jgi:hypothetical protein
LVAFDLLAANGDPATIGWELFGGLEYMTLVACGQAASFGEAKAAYWFDRIQPKLSASHGLTLQAREKPHHGFGTWTPPFPREPQRSAAC